MWTSVTVCSYQSPEPAFFTMDVPALDGGKWHRVGVLETEGGGGEFNSKDTPVTVNINQNNTVHP